MARACVIVLDAVGAGELPDAAEYGDEGSNTLGNAASWAIPVTGGLWLANPNYTVAASNGSSIATASTPSSSGSVCGVTS